MYLIAILFALLPGNAACHVIVEADGGPMVQVHNEHWGRWVGIRWGVMDPVTGQTGYQGAADYALTLNHLGTIYAQRCWWVLEPDEDGKVTLEQDFEFYVLHVRSEGSQ